MAQTKLKLTLATSALLGSTLPAMAQDMCGGAGAGGQWIGGSEDASDIAASDTFKEQMALVLGGNQYVSLFSLSAPSSVRIEAQGRGSGDPYIDIVNGDGDIIASDDDSGGEGASRAELDLDAGNYCMIMASYDGAPMTAFVRVGLDSHEALTPGITTDAPLPEAVEGGGSCADAPSMGILNGPLVYEASAEAAPYLRFTLAEETPISVLASNEDADPTITLFDIAENYLDENDDFIGLDSRIDMEDPLPAGEYCISLGALSDTSLPIVVEVQEYDPVAAQAGLYDRGEAAPPMDGSHPFEHLGALQGRVLLDADINETTSWFAIDTDSGLLVIEAVSGDGAGDPSVVLFDDFGRQIALNDDFGGSYDSFLAAPVNSGTYMFGVKQVEAGVTSKIRIGLQRYVPAK